MNRLHILIPSVLLALLITVFIGCERPSLWVSSDEYKQVEPSDVIAKRIEAHEKSLMAKLHDLFGEG